MVKSLFDDDEPAETTPETDEPSEPAFNPLPYSPPSTGEAVRRSGLAWSAGIMFVGSVGFMLFMGWLADLLFGSFPWGIVIGIVLGSIIGFIQFFRISSQIYSPEKADRGVPSLLSHTEDEAEIRKDEPLEKSEPPDQPPVRSTYPTMTQFAKRVVLHSHSPYSAEHDKLLQDLIDAKVLLFCTVGTECEIWHDVMDEMIVGDGTIELDFDMMTTWHDGESLEEVLEFARDFSIDSPDQTVQVIEV